MILYFFSKILTRAQMLLAITMPSAKLSLHLMPAVFVMTTARRTRSQCVHPTRQHLRTSAFVCWTFAGARVTTLSIIPAVVQVRERFLRLFRTNLTSICRALVLWDMVLLMTFDITQFGGHLGRHLGINSWLNDYFSYFGTVLNATKCQSYSGTIWLCDCTISL